VFPKSDGLDFVDAGFDIFLGVSGVESSAGSRHQILPVNDLVRTRRNARSKECNEFSHQLPTKKQSKLADISLILRIPYKVASVGGIGVDPSSRTNLPNSMVGSVAKMRP